jgi:hypothetical protein
VIDIEQVRELIQEAVNEAAESGIATTLEYIDKSISYDSFGGMKEKLDIEIRVRATPPNDETTSVEIQGSSSTTPPYAG